MKLLTRSVCTLVMALAIASVLSAGTLFVSGDGAPGPSMTEEFNLSSFGGFTPAQNVGITPHPAWEPNHNLTTGAVWVSFRDTGYGGQPEAPNNSQNPTAEFWEVFNLAALPDQDVILNVWADDTAGVKFNGKQLILPNFTQDGACAAGPVGCEHSDVFSVHLNPADFVVGRNELVVSAYQTGGETFGVMYEASSVPEPGTYALIGLGLAGVGVIRRVRASRC